MSLKETVIFTLTIAGLSCCSTQHFRKQQRASLTEATELHAATVESLRSQKETPISWQSASALVLKQNTSLRSTQLRIDELLNKRKNFILRELTPSISTFLSLRLELDKLAALNSDNISASAFMRLPSPNPFSLYQRSYALNLQLYQALHQFELHKRQRLSTLYRLFLQQDQLRSRLASQENKKNAAESSVSPSNLGKLDSLTLNIESTKQSILSNQLSLNSLLNTPGKRWAPKAKTLPSISYASRLDSLTLNNGFGTLSIKMAAAGLHASALGLKQFQLAKIPNIGVNLSNPSLYNSANDEGLEFNTENMNLFTSLSKTFRFDGETKLRKAGALERAKLAKEQLVLGMEQEAHTLSRAKDSYKKLSQKIHATKKLLSQVTNAPQQLGYTSIKQQWSQVESLKKNLEYLEIQRTQLDLQFWIWDDKAWPKIKDPTEPKPKKKSAQTRKVKS